jgi:hypothetical protein
MTFNFNLLHKDMSRIKLSKNPAGILGDVQMLFKAKASVKMSIEEASGVSTMSKTQESSHRIQVSSAEALTTPKEECNLSAHIDEFDTHADSDISVGSSFLRPFADKRWWRRSSSQTDNVKDMQKVIFNFYRPPSAGGREVTASQEGSMYESFPPPQPRRGSFAGAIIDLISNGSSVSDRSNSLLKEECIVKEEGV